MTLLVPLGLYLAMTLVVPVVNGADVSAAHALVVLAVTTIVAAPFAFFSLRRR